LLVAERARHDLAQIVECYALLERLAPSALHTLNRAVAVAEWRGPREGLAILEGLEPPSWLAGSYMWMAVLADLHRRRGNGEIAQRYRDAALASAPPGAVRDVLERRLQIVAAVKKRKKPPSSRSGNKEGASSRLSAAWHERHPMPKNPTTEQRLAWHQAHEKNCGCRPMPAKLRALLR
jgi:hypothetical protein